MTQTAKPTTTTPPDIPTIATHEQHVRVQQHWRTVWLSVGVLQAYYLCAAWLPHPLQLPVAWLVILPPLVPSVMIAAVSWWWQPWRPRPATHPFEPIPPEEDPTP
jgi:hypothetical protein